MPSFGRVVFLWVLLCVSLINVLLYPDIFQKRNFRESRTILIPPTYASIEDRRRWKRPGNP